MFREVVGPKDTVEKYCSGLRLVLRGGNKVKGGRWGINDDAMSAGVAAAS